MKNPSKVERVIYMLKLRFPGIVEVPAKTSKYRVFKAQVRYDGKPAEDRLYFVGKAGALRAGKSSSKSVSLELYLPQLLAKHPHPDFKPEIVAIEMLKSAACYIYWHNIGKLSAAVPVDPSDREAAELLAQAVTEIEKAL